MLEQLAPLILELQGTGRLTAVLQEGGDREMVEVGAFRIEAVSSSRDRGNAPSFGLIAAVDKDELVVAGSGLTLAFGYRTPGPRITRILRIDEGRFQGEKWVPGRRLNGDESAGGARMILPPGPPAIQRVRLYRHD